MKHWITSYDYEPSFCEFSYFTEDTIAYDIETTGLSKKAHQIYMIGCSYRIKNSITIEQFFAENPAEEVTILESFLKVASRYKRQMTFNGARFDTPFLISKCERYQLDASPLSMEHFDIYKECTKLKHVLQLSSCKQKSIEEFLGIHRDDKYNGGELISVYQTYCSAPDPMAMDLLKLHNSDDMKGMIRLLPILTYQNLFHISVTDLTVEKNTYTTVSGDAGVELLFSGKTDITYPVSVHIHSLYGCIAITGDAIQGSVLLYKGTLKHFLPDAKNYVYLKDENIVILKSMAGSIPAERKQPATPDLCHIKKDGIFLKIPSILPLTDDIHVFKEDRKSKDCYLLFDESEFDSTFATHYFRGIIHDCK